MMKKLSKLLILCILLILPGCWDYRDINERSIVLSVGVDTLGDQVEFTGEIAKLRSGAGEDMNQNLAEGTYYMEAYGKDFEEVRIHYDATFPYPIFLGATQSVIFGENFAKQGIEPYLNRINKFYDYRKTLITIVSQVPPRELYKINQDKETSVGLLVEKIVDNLKRNKMTVYSSFDELLSLIQLDGVGYLLPYVGLKNDDIAYLGLAVMKDSKLVSIIDYEETDGLIYALAEKPVLTESLFSSEDKENKASLRTAVKRRRIKTEYRDEKVVFNMDLLVNGELRYQYFLRPIPKEEEKYLENLICQKIKKDITNIFERSQKEFKCDIFQFAKHFRAEHPEIYRKLNWEEAYMTAELNVNVESEIINLGLTDPNVDKK